MLVEHRALFWCADPCCGAAEQLVTFCLVSRCVEAPFFEFSFYVLLLKEIALHLFLYVSPEVCVQVCLMDPKTYYQINRSLVEVRFLELRKNKQHTLDAKTSYQIDRSLVEVRGSHELFCLLCFRGP